MNPLSIFILTICFIIGLILLTYDKDETEI